MVIANFLYVFKGARRIFDENIFWALDLQQITEFLSELMYQVDLISKLLLEISSHELRNQWTGLIRNEKTTITSLLSETEPLG